MGLPNRAWYGIKESLNFFNYCINHIGSTEEWLKVREVIDQYLAREPKVGRQIGSSKIYMIPLRIRRHECWFYYSVEDNLGIITLLELHERQEATEIE